MPQAPGTHYFSGGLLFPSPDFHSTDTTFHITTAFYLLQYLNKNDKSNINISWQTSCSCNRLELLIEFKWLKCGRVHVRTGLLLFAFPLPFSIESWISPSSHLQNSICQSSGPTNSKPLLGVDEWLSPGMLYHQQLQSVTIYCDKLPVHPFSPRNIPGTGYVVLPDHLIISRQSAIIVL